MIDASADGVEFPTPLTADELAKLRRIVECPTRELERAGREDKAKLIEEIGTRLFEAVFSGAVREAWREELKGASSQGRRLILRLHLAAPEAARWPWEYLRDPRSGHFLGLNPDISIVRLPGETVSIRPLGVAPPFRILGVISNPVDSQPLAGEQEWRKLEASLSSLVTEGRVALELLGSATLEALNGRLRQTERPCHALHFIGHGGFDRERRDGALYFEDEARRAHPVRAEELGTILYNRKLRLAVLNACYGAHGDPADPFSSVAQSLIRRKVAAVVAMQYAVSDPFALAFSSELYSRLVAGDPIDAAMAEARLALFSKDFKLEWGNPVLYLRSSEGRIFDVRRSRRSSSRPPAGPPSAASGPDTRPLALTAATPSLPMESGSSFWNNPLFRGLAISLAFVVIVAAAIPAVWERFKPEAVPHKETPPSASPQTAPVLPSTHPRCPSPGNLGFKFALIEPGDFTVGSGKGSQLLRFPEELCVSIYETTGAQWTAVMKAPTGRDGNFPVMDKSLEDAESFVEEMERSYPGDGYRLLTADEWEYAGRANSTDSYSFGDDVEQLRFYANCRGGADGHDEVARVGSQRPNSFGLYDMEGNVWEWVSTRGKPEKPGEEPPGIRMGGSWNIKPARCTIDRQAISASDSRQQDYGFRIARKPLPPNQDKGAAAGTTKNPQP